MKTGIRWLAFMLGALLMAGCQLGSTSPASTESPTANVTAAPQIHLTQPFTMRVGESVAFEDYTITFIEVTEDSRCPSDVQCVQAGWVTVKLEVRSKGKPFAEVELSFGGFGADKSSNANMGGLLTELIDVQPVPVSTQPLAPEDYEITLVVSPEN